MKTLEELDNEHLRKENARLRKENTRLVARLARYEGDLNLGGGLNLLEYGLLLGLIAVVVIAAVTLLGGQIDNILGALK